MADIDYRKLTDKQLEAVAAVNGDFSKLSDTDFKSIDATLNPGLARRAVNAVDDNVVAPINDLVNWAGTQFTKGGTGVLGAPRAFADLLDAGATWAGDKLGVPETGRKIGAGAKFAIPGGTGPRAEDLNRIIFAPPAGDNKPSPVGFNLGVPEVNAGDNPALTINNPVLGKVNLGKMADVGAQAIPMAIAGGPGTILPNFFGGVTSEAAGQATAGTPYEIPARILGAFPGAYAGAKLTTPLPANLTPQQARVVDIAKNPPPGLPPTPLSVAQETGRGTALERLFARMPGGQGVSDRFAAKQGASTDERALATAGFKGNELGQDTMKAVRKQVGPAFDEQIANTPKVELKPDFYNKSGQSIGTYTENVAASEIIPKVANKLDDFMDPKLMKGGAFPELSGQQYQTFRSDLTKSVHALYQNGKSGAGDALKGVREALDEAAAATLPADRVAAWQEARKNYSNFKILQRAMNMGTASARSEGTLGANALTNALRQRQGANFYETTGGLNDIASLKGYLRDTFPNSGTPTIGAQAAAAYHPLWSIAPMAAVNLGQRAMTGGGPVSSVVRNYLANQVAPNRLNVAGFSAPETAATAPLSLAPGILTDPRLLERRK